MNKKDSIDIILNLLKEETKRLKKKKKKEFPIAAPILRRPMGSIFSMDAGVSMAESFNLNNIKYNLRWPNKNTIVYVSPEKILNRAAKDNPDFDVMNPKNQIGNRISKAKDFILNYSKDRRLINQKTGERTKYEAEFEPSVASIYDGKLGFEDGRHRILAAKDLGIKKVAVEVPKNQAEEFNQQFGDGVSEGILNEGYGQKVVTKKFDHLKWPLNEFQKHFLDDFINIADDSLKKEDYEYASKRTNIPIESIRSIKNTLSEKKTPKATLEEMGKNHRELVGATLGIANSQFTDVRDAPKNKEGRQWSMNPNPEFRGKSLKELKWEDEMSSLGGKLTRKHEVELPKFMYEWLLYFIEGSERFKITESKLMNDFHSSKFDSYKFILFSFDAQLKESSAHAYDLASTDSKLKEIDEFREKIKEFNSTFSTNFIITNQYTGNDGFLKVVIENAQITDGKDIYNRKFINMEDNDIKKAISLGFYDQFTTTRSITG